MFRNFLLMYFCRKKIRNFMANLPAYKWWARLSFFISLLMSFFSATVINERSNYFHLASSFPQKMFHCSLKHNWLNWKILRPSKSNLISKLVPTTQVTIDYLVCYPPNKKTSWLYFVLRTFGTFDKTHNYQILLYWGWLLRQDKEKLPR